MSGGTGSGAASSMPAMDNCFLSTYHRLLSDAAHTGQCPVWIADLSRSDPPDDRERILAELDGRDADEVLAGQWLGACPCCDEHQNPFRDGFPGLLSRPAVDREDAIWHAARVTNSRSWGEPDLVPASRPADVPAIIGWMGSCNSWRDTVGMSAVLRSWEERFGALLFRMSVSTLELAVAAPPATEDECIRVAAEHDAFGDSESRRDGRPRCSIFYDQRSLPSRLSLGAFDLTGRS